MNSDQDTKTGSMNKTAMFLSGMTGSELRPCEGYIAKLQKRAAKNLMQFRDDLRLLLITRDIVYWDDTVVCILTKRACLRFYGDEKIAYYTAHEHKDMSGIDEDNVLQLLTEETKVMHDHNTVNYNPKYMFQNIECNQHLERDCQKNTDDTGHKWSEELKGYINSAIHDRNKSIKKSRDSFDKAYIEKFNRDVEKISGQFESVNAADNYALIRSYIETCRRNGINEIDALIHLSAGRPYIVKEIFKT